MGSLCQWTRAASPDGGYERIPTDRVGPVDIDQETERFAPALGAATACCY